MERLNLNSTNPFKLEETIKNYIKSSRSAEIEIDLSSLNIIDSVKVLVLSSAYHYTKHPDGKLTCHTSSGEIKSLMAPFAMQNLELV